MTWKLHDPPEMMGVHGTPPLWRMWRSVGLGPDPLHVYHGSSTTASQCARAPIDSRMLYCVCLHARMRRGRHAAGRLRSDHIGAARGHSPALCVCAAVRCGV